MKNKKNPKEFLGAKVLSTFEDAKIRGGAKKKVGEYQACGGQNYIGQGQQCDPPQHQQQQQSQF